MSLWWILLPAGEHATCSHTLEVKSSRSSSWMIYSGKLTCTSQSGDLMIWWCISVCRPVKKAYWTRYQIRRAEKKKEVTIRSSVQEIGFAELLCLNNHVPFRQNHSDNIQACSWSRSQWVPTGIFVSAAKWIMGNAWGSTNELVSFLQGNYIYVVFYISLYKSCMNQKVEFSWDQRWAKPCNARIN